VDGDVHDEQRERDAARTEMLNARGIRVIRFRNDEVLNQTRTVLLRIQSVLAER
jgi:leucyl-tRNA synthetase